MNTTGTSNQNMSHMLKRFRFQRGLLFGTLIVIALFAFEIFNYSTTDYALTDLLGPLRFAGVRWATILAIAFCGIDFAGIARLFTPQDNAEDTAEVWYLFGAWMLAATMNAMLTWWGVSLAILNHQTLGNAVIERQTLLKVVPIFVAVMVWLIRVLIIGTFSVAGERIFGQTATRTPVPRRSPVRTLGESTRSTAEAPGMRPLTRPQPTPVVASNYRTSRRLNSSTINDTENENLGYTRPEPTYHPAAMSAHNSNGRDQSTRR
jgi:hypothetical protein